MEERAYILLADVEIGGRAWSAGSVGSEDGFGAAFQPLLEAELLYGFDPAGDWPTAACSRKVDLSTEVVLDARELVGLLDEGGTWNRDKISRQARRILYALESHPEVATVATSRAVAEGPFKSGRSASSTV